MKIWLKRNLRKFRGFMGFGGGDRKEKVEMDGGAEATISSFKSYLMKLMENLEELD